MGLDFSHGNARWAYSGFMRFRVRLAQAESIDLESMAGFRGAVLWDRVTTPLRPLLDHSDCDGELTPDECRQVAPRLKEIVAGWLLDDGDRDRGLELVAAPGVPRRPRRVRLLHRRLHRGTRRGERQRMARTLARQGDNTMTTEAATPDGDLMPDGYPRYSLFAPDKITYHGGGWWSMPSTGSNGSARFSGEYDCNPVCGCHLASKCGTCNVCTDCDGCYCGEWE